MLGVILFFVLSGFLISYLFFREQSNTGDINIRKFYIRRILRIWPLYFFIILLSLFVLPYIQFLHYPGAAFLDMETKIYKALPLYMLFLPNLVMVAINSIPFCSQTWSIGVEEQFYLIWPILNKYFKSKLGIAVFVVILYLIIKFMILLNVIGSGQNSLFFQFWESMPIQFMAIGSFFAYLAYFDTKLTIAFKRFFYHPIFQILTVLVIIICLTLDLKVKYFNLEMYAMLFGIVILNASTGTSNIFKLNNTILRYLGKISYGLYMYHFVCIVFVIQLLSKWNLNNEIFLVYISVLLSTILVSSISYRTIEHYFLRYKSRFSIIASGQSVEGLINNKNH